MGALSMRAYTDGPATSLVIVARPEKLSPADRLQAAFVARMRARGAGWAAIGKMISRSEPDTRMAFDPDYEPPAMFLRPTAAKRVEIPASLSARAVTAAPRRAPPSTVRAGSLEAALVAALSGKARSSAQLQDTLGWTEPRTRHTAQALRKKGLIAFDGWRWRLTDSGKTQQAALAGGAS